MTTPSTSAQGPGERAFWETQRDIPHLEADAAATRLINSHFKNDAERARVSIPANPDRDDDLLIRSYIRQQMRKDTTASPSPAASGASPSGVRVKPLEWESGDGTVHDALSWRGKVEPLGLIYCVVDRQWWLVGSHSVANQCDSDDAAKAAAQADYEARILSAQIGA